MENNIKLSVIIISYKQRKYIKEAINSVLNQKVNFKYELLLADDCSQDGTLEIMREYEKKYPDVVRVLERKENLGGANNSFNALCNANGKYITCLEGDDYWCNENKLQLQYDFLETHPDFCAVSHLQEGRNLKGEFQGNFPVGIHKDKIIDDIQQYINSDVSFSVSATMYTNFLKDNTLRKKYDKIRRFDSLIGDAQMNIFLLTIGKVYIMSKPMMVYRMRNNDGNSNFNSSHSVNEIEYRYMNIYIQLEKFYGERYSFYKKIKKNYTLGVVYDICKLKFNDIKNFNKLCPKKYKFKIWIFFPFTCINIIYKRFIKK